MPEMASNRFCERSFESNRVVDFHLPEMASDFFGKKEKVLIFESAFYR